MAPRKSLKDLSGKWSMNRDLSTDVDPVLKLQGFNIMMRKAISVAPVNLNIKQPSDNEIHIEQSTTAAVLAVIKEEWYFDWESRDQKDAFLGKVKSKSRWTTAKEIKDGFLTGELDPEEEIIEAEVESYDYGWKARQVWTFEGEHFVRRVVTTKGEERVESVLIYQPKAADVPL